MRKEGNKKKKNKENRKRNKPAKEDGRKKK